MLVWCDGKKYWNDDASFVGREVENTALGPTHLFDPAGSLAFKPHFRGAPATQDLNPGIERVAPPVEFLGSANISGAFRLLKWLFLDSYHNTR